MSANSTDYFTEVGNPGSATTLSAPGHAVAGTAITVVATTNWPTTTGAIFAMDTFTTINGVEVRDVGSYTEWEGVVSSSTSITGMVLRYGTDQIYPAGANTRVYIPVASSRENRLVQGIQVHANEDGTLKNNAITSAAQITDGIIGDAEMATAVKPVTIESENTFDFIASGCVWTADAAGSTRLASMTSGVVYLSGKRLTVAAVTSRTFTASKDVYVDFSDNSDGTALITYTDNTTNAASPALTGVRAAIVVVGASNIAAAASINQGQEDRVLPIASSIPYAVTDSLGNLICPRDPQRKLLGYRQVVAGFTTTSTSDVVGLNVTCLIPTGRKVKVSAFVQTITSSVANSGGTLAVIDVTGSATVVNMSGTTNTSADATGVNPSTIRTFAAGTRNFKTTLTRGTNAATVTGNAASTNPAYVMVELA